MNIVTAFDAWVASLIAPLRTPGVLQGCEAVSAVGAPVSIAALTLVVCGVLMVGRQWRLAVAFAMCMAGAGIVNRTIKMFVQRARPDGAEEWLFDASYSFPSGHTVGAAVFFLLFAHVLARASSRERTRAALAMGAFSVVAAIAFSRLCLGVHYATDVIGALLIAGVWTAICSRFLNSMVPSSSDPPRMMSTSTR